MKSLLFGILVSTIVCPISLVNAQETQGCFITTSSGKTIDLSSMCNAKPPTAPARSYTPPSTYNPSQHQPRTITIYTPSRPSIGYSPQYNPPYQRPVASGRR